MSGAEPPENMYGELTEDQKELRDEAARFGNNKAMLTEAEAAQAAGDMKRAQVLRRLIGD